MDVSADPTKVDLIKLCLMLLYRVTSFFATIQREGTGTIPIARYMLEAGGLWNPTVFEMAPMSFRSITFTIMTRSASCV